MSETAEQLKLFYLNFEMLAIVVKSGYLINLPVTAKTPGSSLSYTRGISISIIHGFLFFFCILCNVHISN